MSYLYINDYKKSIQQINLMQVVGGDFSILMQWQLAAEEKAVSYLTQKYATEVEFTNTSVWDAFKIYGAGDRVYLDATPYIPDTTYTVKSLVLQNGRIYYALQTTTGNFDPAAWVSLGNQYDLFYGTYPYPVFNVNEFYKKGTMVFWNGYVYTAQSDSAYPNINNIQYGQYRYVPQNNYFPGDPQNYNQWGTGVAFSIPGGTLPTDGVLWTKGDNRGQQMVQTCADLVIFYIHQRISPQNIPVNRTENYRMAVQWLRDAGEGVVTPKLPKRQPNQGNRIRYGGNVQNVNHY